MPSSPISPTFFVPALASNAQGQGQGHGLSLEVWEECQRRLAPLSRAARTWSRIGGPHSMSATNLNSPSPTSVNVNDPAHLSSSAAFASGEERERRQFVAAVKDGYVLCQ